MKISRAACIAASGLWLLGTGCTALREIPRGEYAALPERKDVRIHTRDGLVYEFDYARILSDSLVGFRRRDVEGSLEDFASHRVALEDIDQLSVRGVDWYRTGLVGGGALVAIVIGGLSAAGRNKSDQPTSGGGKITPESNGRAR